MDLHASQIQGFFDVPVDKCVYPCQGVLVLVANHELVTA